MNAISRHPRRARLALLVALLTLFVGLRLAFLTADPPLFLPNGLIANELFVEPPAKAHEARNLALFGAWQTSPVDNYQFWRVQSPVWVYPLAAWFRAFGVSYASLRVFAVLGATAGFLALLALASRRLGLLGIACAGLLTATDFYSIQFGRAGLLEPLCIGFLTLAMYALLRAKDDLRWLLLAEWALCLALLTKQTAAYFAPLALGLALDALLRGRGPRRRAVELAVVLQGAVMAAALAYYVSRPAYVRTMIWNYGHMLIGGDGYEALREGKLPSLTRVLARMTSLERYEDFYFYTLPVTGGVAVLGLGRVAFRAFVRRDYDRWSIAIALWLLSGWGALLLTDEIDVRFRLILFPPTALLGASTMEWLAGFRPARLTPWLRYGALAWLLGAFLRLNGPEYVAWALERDHTISAVNAKIHATIGDRRAVVVGLWAAPLTFETPYLCYYVKNDFNATREALTALGVTHGLIREGPDWSRTIVKRNFPTEYERAATAGSYFVRGTVLLLRDFGGALGAPPAMRRGPVPELKR